MLQNDSLDKTIEIAVSELLQAPDTNIVGERNLNFVDEKDGSIHVCIAVDPINSPLERFALEDAIRDMVNKMEGVKNTRVTSCSIFGDAPVENSCHANDPEESMHTGDLPERKQLPGVEHICLVCSAKGGVGKSTIALNTALALAAKGKRVGLLDLDLYGPSIPSLVGKDLPPIVIENLIIPPEVYGISVLSIGFMIDKDQPLIWRGPMVASVIKQLLWEVNWAGLDYLLIDMPPGTGDSYLSVLQTLKLDNSIIVTTPSELALADVTRGVGLFAPFDVPILGVVENMSTFAWNKAQEALELVDRISSLAPEECKKLTQLIQTTKNIRIFGDKTESRCKELGLPIIASIPLDTTLQKNNDSGVPYMLQNENSEIRKQFEKIADKILDSELNP